MFKKISQRIASILMAFVLVAGVPFGYGCQPPPVKNPCEVCGKEPCICVPEPTARSIGFITGTGQGIDPIVAEPGEKVNAPKAPEREGFVFDGWLLNGAPYEFGVMPDEDIELVAKWNQIFRITFDTGVDDLIVAPIFSIQGENISAPPDPMRVGQRFAGWYDGDGERFYFTTMPAKDIKLTAKWAKVVKITLNSGVMDLDVAPISELPGTPISAPPDPQRPGFLFLGWYLGGAETPYVFTVVPDSDIRLDAKWVAAATISFATGVPGLTVAPIKAPVGSDVKKPKDPVRTDGYLFDGWLLSGEPYKFTVIPSRDITLTAKWLAACTITFNADADGIEVPAMVEVPGKLIDDPPVPLRPGYHLEGWYRPDGKLFIFNVMPSSNITLKAKWVQSTKLPTISVVLHGEDGTVNPSSTLSGSRGSVPYRRCTFGWAQSGGTSNLFKGQIRPKGNGSWRNNVTERRPYRVRLDKKRVMLPGWARSRQYTLAAVMHNNDDPSRLVTYSSYNLAVSDVTSNLEFGARAYPVDFYINGTYHGVYVLTETVKVEEGRVDIESAYSGTTAPYNVDTGYLLFTGNSTHTEDFEDSRAYFEAGGRKFLIETPDPDEINDPEYPEVTGAGYNAQRTFIQSATSNLMSMLSSRNFNEFNRLADVNSWVDGYIIQELYRNVDVGAGGFYIYKKGASQGGKFFCGPPWDMDCTTGGSFEGIAIGENASGSASNALLTGPYAMPQFKALVIARWKEIGGDIKGFITNAFNEFALDPLYRAAFQRGAGGSHNDGYVSSGWLTRANEKRSWLENRCDWLTGYWV